MDQLIYNVNQLFIRKELIKNIMNKTKTPPERIDSLLPTIELYEFEIKGYPATPDHVYVKFKNFVDGSHNSCNSININAINTKYNLNKISSCDIITGEPQIGGDWDLELKYFNNLYSKIAAKAPLEIDNMYSGQLSEIQHYFNWAIDRNYAYINNNILISVIPDYKNEPDKLHNGALVFHINVKNTDKIIVFGDHHGSFHTFYRNLARLHKIGVIDLSKEKYKINDGYKLIFLGDILDRGKYALEILIIIIKFILMNNTKDNLKIILNRGNHEDIKVYQYHGFLDELTKKGLYTLNNNIKTFISLCPSAIILENESKQRFWLSHGGFPLINIDIGLSKSNRAIIKSADPVDYKNNNKIWFHEYNETSIINNILITIPEQIRWNDFNYQEGPYSPGAINGLIGTKGRGIAIELNQFTIQDFLLENNIQFIIRAHQDNIDNSWILSSQHITGGGLGASTHTPEFFCINEIIDATDINTGIYMNPNKIIDPTRNVVNGPIGRIRLDGMKWMPGLSINENAKIYPLLTLSTNTDLGRTLIHDSFAIIRFDLTETTIKQFDETINIIDTKNTMQSFTDIFK